MKKIHEYKELQLKLTGSPHYVEFEDGEYKWTISPTGVSVAGHLVHYFYPVHNIVECKHVTTLYDDDGNQVHNLEGDYDA